MAQVKLEEQSIDQLKVLAYDAQAAAQYYNQVLHAVNEEIAKRVTKPEVLGDELTLAEEV